MALVDRDRRARAKALKAERKEAVEAAARRAFETKPLSGLSLPTIGQMAGVRSGKPELYYGSLEELFLLVLDQEHRAWAEDLQVRLGKPPRGIEPSRLGRRIAASLASRGLLARLWGLAYQVYESQVDVSVALGTVDAWMERHESLGRIIARRCSHFDRTEAAIVLRRCLDVAAGLHPACYPSGAVAMRVASAGEPPEWARELSKVLAGVVASSVGGGQEGEVQSD